MKKSRFSDQQIAFILRQAEEGTTVEEVCRKAGIPGTLNARNTSSTRRITSGRRRLRHHVGTAAAGVLGLAEDEDALRRHDVEALGDKDSERGHSCSPRSVGHSLGQPDGEAVALLNHFSGAPTRSLPLPSRGTGTVQLDTQSALAGENIFTFLREK